MAAVTQTVGTRTSLTGVSTTLASATYDDSATYTCNTNKPLDVIVEASPTTTNTPSGNKKVDIFITESLDGTNFRSGPVSGTTTTREPNLLYLGSVPLTTASQAEFGFFSIRSVLGYVPHSFKIVAKNDAGVALTGFTLYTSEISETVA